MNKPRECLPSSFRGTSEIKKLEDTQKALIARNMNMYANKKCLSRQRTASLSSSVGSSYRSAIETSVTTVGKMKPCGYLTLLDVSALSGLPTPSSSVLPVTEIVPNSFHQKFHVSRWKSFVKMTPKWILEMGLEGLDMRQRDRNRKTQKGSDKENFSVTDKSDVRLLQEKHGNENNVCVSNVEECTVENPEMEKEFGREKHEISERENGTSVCTEEWRDWSLQLTGRGSLVITGKAHKNVVKRSRDVSSCQRVDARTLRLADGTVYKLVGMPDHFTNLPYYVRNKFQCGFPADWKEVKLAWEKYEKQGSPCSFSWLQAHLPECGNSSTVQKDKTVCQTLSPVEESKSGESPPAALNSVVQSVYSDKARVASMDRVGEAQSRLTLERELRKQLGAEETGANRVGEARSRLTVERELGKQLGAEEMGVGRVREARSRLTVERELGKQLGAEKTGADRVGEARSRLTVERELGKQLGAKEKGVGRVGEARSRLTVERELGKQLGTEETGADRVGEARLRLTVERELGKQLRAEEKGVGRVGEARSRLTVEWELGKLLGAEKTGADRVGEARSRLTVERELGKQLGAEETGVGRVGEARSGLTVERELGKQLGTEETGVCNQKQNSTVAQECGEKTIVERREAACVVNPSFVSSQEAVKKLHLKELEVRLKQLSSSVIEKYIRRTNFAETDVSSKRLSDDLVSLVEQTGTVPVSNMSSVMMPADTDRTSSCDTSNSTRAPVNTASGAGEGNTLVNPYILYGWTPVLLPRKKLKFVGLLKSARSPDRLHTTDVMHRRKDFDRVMCCDGTFYRLQGSYADPRNTIPSLIKKQLHGGLPHRWRQMVETWVNLVAVQLAEREPRQESTEASASAASTFEHTESADRSAGCDELVDETVQHAAIVTGLDEREATELSTALDDSDSISEAAERNLMMYGKGSLIPLRKFEVQGIIKKSSRGRVVFPPVRYWLGERLVQQHNQPAFFCPRTGVREVIVDRRVDSVPSERDVKKRKCLASESESSSLSKRRCNKGETEFAVPREKHRAFLHGTVSGRDWKANSQASKGRRALEVGTNMKNHSRFIPKQQGSCSSISESGDSLSDDIPVQAREGSRIVSGKSQMLERMLASKSVSSGQSLNSTANTREKCSLGTQKHQGLENFKAGTSKQRGYVDPPFDLLDSEDELQADMPTDAGVHNRGAYNPSSARSAALSFPWQQHRGKEMDRFVNRQQTMESNVNKLLLKPATGSKAGQFGTASAHINPVITVQFDDAVDPTSSFDEEDLSTSYVSTAYSGK